MNDDPILSAIAAYLLDAAIGEDGALTVHGRVVNALAVLDANGIVTVHDPAEWPEWLRERWLP